MLKAEVTKEMRNEWVAKYLSSMGFDLSKEISCTAKWGEDSVTEVYTQEKDAPEIEEIREQKALTDRPDYLKNL